MIVFPGGVELNSLERKLDKLLESFATARYDFPPTRALFEAKQNEVASKLIENK
jgi:hypothetical protein